VPVKYHLSILLSNEDVKNKTYAQKVKKRSKHAFDYITKHKNYQLGWRLRDYFMIPFGGRLHTSIKTQAAPPQAFLFSKLAEASFARSENKKPTKIRGF
jgi:hypothetical protein